MAVMEEDPITKPLAQEVWAMVGANLAVVNLPVLHEGEWYSGSDVLHRCPNTGCDGSGRPHDIDTLKSYFAGWDPRVQKVVSYATKVNVWRIIETMPKNWVSQSGRVVLVGDTCHAISPNIGQGGGLAIEDALTIAECLSRAEDPVNLLKVIKLFQEIRKPRCQLIQTQGQVLRGLAMLSDGPEQEARDKAYRTFSTFQYTEPWDGKHIDDVPSDLRAPNFNHWVHGHDARLLVSDVGHKNCSRLTSARPSVNWTTSSTPALRRARITTVTVFLQPSQPDGFRAYI
jgi:salicylate hydroxylase